MKQMTSSQIDTLNTTEVRNNQIRNNTSRSENRKSKQNKSYDNTAYKKIKFKMLANWRPDSKKTQTVQLQQPD